MNKYPMLELNTDCIYNNTKTISELCKNHGIKISGVIKGFNAVPELTKKMVEGGCDWIASSRIEQLKAVKEQMIGKPLMLLRIPMFCEVESVVKYCDVSLNSEKETIIKLNEESIKQNKVHKVIVMYDLGDLREGIFNKVELVNLCEFVEHSLKNIELYGIGTNLSCYGSVMPNVKNLTELCNAAEEVENRIGRKLEIVSGGATTSLPVLCKGEMPKKINHLRIGEAIINAQDLPLYWDVYISGLKKDTFVLKAQIIELNEKPTHPIGELSINAFGDKPVYIDKGIKKRAILAIGNQDLGSVFKIIPKDENIKILGGSSDHTIIDIQDCKKEYRLGDIVEFNVLYQAMLFATQSPSVNKVIL